MTLYGAHNINIKKSVFSIADKATIELPTFINKTRNKAGWAESDSIQSLKSKREKLAKYLAKGLRVEIEIGYNGKLNKEFTGFISNIEENKSLVITLEGLSYLLRTSKLDKKSFKSATLKEILDYLISKAGLETTGVPRPKNILEFVQQLIIELDYKNIPEVTIKNYVIDSSLTPLGEIQKLIDQYLLVAFFRGQILHVVLMQQIKALDVKYSLTKNVISKDNLKWIEQEPINLVMHLESVAGEKATIQVGDRNGRQVKIEQTGSLLNKDFYEKLLSHNLKAVENVGGYVGNMETFLIPNVEVSSHATIFNEEYPSRNGVYFVSSVETNFGTSGGRRIVELNGRLS